MMGRFGIPEDEPIQNGLITKTLEGAQAKIEGFHFDARKNTLEYDNVLNHQRNSIYDRRRKMLLADKEGIEEVLNNVIAFNPDLANIIEEKRTKLGEVSFLETVRRIALYTNDTLWMEHIKAMDYLRSAVNLRAYGQREPLIEYKKDGLKMFKEMESLFYDQVSSLISNIILKI